MEVKKVFFMTLVSLFLFSCELSLEHSGSVLQQHHYSLTYNGNSQDGGTVPAFMQSAAPGTEILVMGNSGNLTKDQFDVTGWNTEPDGTGFTLRQGDVLIMPAADVVLYALWEHALGTIGPGGGTIYYRKEVFSDGWQYLEAAWEGWYGSGDDPLLRRNEADEHIDTYMNDKNPFAYYDWYLPSQEELLQLYEYQEHVDGLKSERYWASNIPNVPIRVENNTFIYEEMPVYVHLGDGSSNYVAGDGFNQEYRIRPIRRF